MPRFAVHGPLPTDPELTRIYDEVPGKTPLEALFRVHYDGLGPDRVRLVNDRLEFTDAADQELCAGLWSIVERSGQAVELIIPSPVAIAA
jgi:hypothetical protein